MKNIYTYSRQPAQRHLTVAIAEPNRATRVFVDPSQPLPFHATASGIAILGAMPAQAVQDLDLAVDFYTYTDKTPAHQGTLDTAIKKSRNEGLGRAHNTFEEDVVGTAIPIIGLGDKPIGALAVASVASRYDVALGARIDAALQSAAKDLARQMGG